jgi:hypothetical protein
LKDKGQNKNKIKIEVRRLPLEIKETARGFISST